MSVRRGVERIEDAILRFEGSGGNPAFTPEEIDQEMEDVVLGIDDVKRLTVKRENIEKFLWDKGYPGAAVMAGLKRLDFMSDVEEANVKDDYIGDWRSGFKEFREAANYLVDERLETNPILNRARAVSAGPRFSSFVGAVQKAVFPEPEEVVYDNTFGPYEPEPYDSDATVPLDSDPDF